MKIIKNVTTPKTLFIIGAAINSNGWKRDIKITDDETQFMIKNENEVLFSDNLKNNTFVSDGSISILDEKTFLKFRQDFKDYGLGFEFVKLRNFIGDIAVTFCNEDGAEYDIKLNIKEYITFQDSFINLRKKYEDKSFEVLIKFSKFDNFEIANIDDYENED